jgi:hypothetical protein
LFGLLEFDDDSRSFDGLTVEIKNGFSVEFRISELFVIGVVEIDNFRFFILQYGIEKIDQAGFVGFGPEKSFEAKVCEEIDVFLLHGMILGNWLEEQGVWPR